MKTYIFLILLIASVLSNAQIVNQLSLTDAIDLALDGSSSAKRISHNQREGYWRYKIYRATVLPNVSLAGTLPDFNRSITPQLLPDGTQDFISYNNWNSSLNLRINQNIPLTGGQIFVSSNLQQIVNVEQEENGTTYFTNPFAIGFNQQLTGFNRFRWLKKTEPMKLEEANREEAEKKEELSMNVVRTFFQVLVAQDNLDMAKKNLSNNEQLYKISQGRYNLGKIAENDLLQMELSVLEASIRVENSQIELQRSLNSFFSILNLPSDSKVNLKIPDDVQPLYVDPDHALEMARSSRKDVISFQRRILEAERNLAEARANKRIQVDLFGSFGLNQSATTFNEAYNNPVDQERFNLGVTVPLYDGRSARSYYKIASSELEVINEEVEELQRTFDREVKLKANEMNLLELQVNISAKSDTIADRRYEISRNRYMQGKIDITELSLSQQSKDNARLAYLSALRDYWFAYYELRMLTLYDYRNKIQLYTD